MHQQQTGDMHAVRLNGPRRSNDQVKSIKFQAASVLVYGVRACVRVCIHMWPFIHLFITWSC